MIKHVVMFRLQDGLTSAQRAEIMGNFKRSIEQLPASIPYIRHIFVGFNVNPKEKWDICLESQFDTLEEVTSYSQHPLHVAAAKALMQFSAERSCVDFELK